MALPEVKAVSTVRRFRLEIAGQPTDMAISYEIAPESYRGFRFKGRRGWRSPAAVLRSTQRRLARSSTAKAMLIAVLIGGTDLDWWIMRAPSPRPEEGTAGPVSASAAIPRRTRATPTPCSR
ncbi:MAG: hypothetical protein ACREXW_09835 [Gammaproteobacteria bacterium]